MADPTWTDELLEKFAGQCSENCRRFIAEAPVSVGTSAIRVFEYLLTWSLFSADADLLRDLIDAELRAGREAKAEASRLARSWKTESNSPAYAVAKAILKAFNSTAQPQHQQPSAVPQTPPKT